MMQSSRTFVFAFVALFSTPSVFAEESCSSITDIICADNAGLNAVCEALLITELADDLSGDTWTVFAPIDDAFEVLGRDNLDALVFGNSTVPLTDLLLFHVIPGQSLTSADLPCVAGQNLVEMANGFSTRTICEFKFPAIQRGQYNDKEDPPRIIESDIPACNGMIHILDKVLLYEDLPYPIPSTLSEPVEETAATTSPTTSPTTLFPTIPIIETIVPTFPNSETNSTVAPTEEEVGCLSITEHACSEPDFSIACTLMTESGLADDLNDGGLWTVFAPSNQAFENAPRFAADTDIEFILQGHIIANAAIPLEDLRCTEKIEMLNGKETRTVCRSDVVYQNGGGNADAQRPAIIGPNVEACNGIIHIIDQVILP